MNLRECSYFIAIAEEQSLSRAAERLYMAQSSLSQFLNSLESELGTKLFARTSKGVRITQAGKLMLTFAYDMQRSFHTIQEQIQDIDMLNGGGIRMGISSFRGSYLLPPVLRAFHAEYPKVSVEIVEENSMALEQLLTRGEIDIALLVLPTAAESHIKTEFVMRDEICIITDDSHPIMKHVRRSEKTSASQIPQYVELQDAIEYEFYLSDYDTIMGREARRIFSRCGMTPITRNEKLTALFAAALGASGQGLAFTYYSSRHYFRDAQFISLGADGSAVDLGIALPPGRYHSKATLAFAQVMKSVLGAEEKEQSADGK